MTDAIDVMKYIRARNAHNYGEVQMQKLAFYVQAWTLAWEGRPMFPDRIEAWKMGPVVRSLRHRQDEGDPGALSAEDAAIVDAVLAHYGALNGQQLAGLSHNETPWKETWDARGHDAEYCDDEIGRDSMRRFYTSQAMRGEGPKRPSSRLVGKVADDAEVFAIAEANDDRWSDALELLGR